MAVRIRVDLKVDQKELVAAIKRAETKLRQRKRIARGEAISNFLLIESQQSNLKETNPILISINKQLQELNLSDKNTIERITRATVEKQFSSNKSSDGILWETILQDVISPVDKRLIVRGKKIGTSRNFQQLQQKLSDLVTKEFSLFITADVSTQIRRGELVVPPPIKAVVIENVLGKNLGETPVSAVKIVSNIQFTILVRNQMTRRMPKGTRVPRLPPPDPSKGLTFRTGKFVNTTEFFIDYKNRIISYFVEPPYNEFLDGKASLQRYQPEEKTIFPSIREAAKLVAADKFNIIRKR